MHRSTAILILTSGLSVSYAADGPECGILPPAEDDPGTIGLEWSETALEQDGLVLGIRALGAEGLEYAVEARLLFNGESITWSQGPYTIDPLETSDVTIALPGPEARRFDARQSVFLTQVFVRVVAYRDEEIVFRKGAEQLSAIIEDDGSIDVLDDTEVQQLAPHGYLSSRLTIDLDALGVSQNDFFTLSPDAVLP